jgi:hypothetical protein
LNHPFFGDKRTSPQPPEDITARAVYLESLGGMPAAQQQQRRNAQQGESLLLAAPILSFHMLSQHFNTFHIKRDISCCCLDIDANLYIMVFCVQTLQPKQPHDWHCERNRYLRPPSMPLEDHIGELSLRWHVADRTPTVQVLSTG